MEHDTFCSASLADYTSVGSAADLFRQIIYGERVDKDSSLAHVTQARFR